MPKAGPYAELARYSGMVFQIFALLFAAWLLGQWLDKKLENEEPYLSLTLIMLSIFAYLYSLVRQTSGKK